MDNRAPVILNGEDLTVEENIRFYADILSILNLLCGIAGLFWVFQGRYVYTAIAILAGQIFDQ